jgi:hypothetical protein
MSGTSTMLMGIAGGASWLLTLALLLTFVIIAATTVRKHRPDAAPILLLALSVEFIFALAGFAAQIILPRFFSVGGDFSHYMEAQAITTVSVSLGHSFARGLLIWAVVRLALPAGA